MHQDDSGPAPAIQGDPGRTPEADAAVSYWLSGHRPIVLTPVGAPIYRPGRGVVRSDGKGPIEAGWADKVYADDDAIRADYRAHPGAGVGLALGLAPEGSPHYARVCPSDHWGLVDLEEDDPEAAAATLAAIFGAKGPPECGWRSHRGQHRGFILHERQARRLLDAGIDPGHARRQEPPVPGGVGAAPGDPGPRPAQADAVGGAADADAEQGRHDLRTPQDGRVQRRVPAPAGAADRLRHRPPGRPGEGCGAAGEGGGPDGGPAAGDGRGPPDLAGRRRRGADPPRGARRPGPPGSGRAGPRPAGHPTRVAAGRAPLRRPLPGPPQPLRPAGQPRRPRGRGRHPAHHLLRRVRVRRGHGRPGAPGGGRLPGVPPRGRGPGGAGGGPTSTPRRARPPSPTRRPTPGRRSRTATPPSWTRGPAGVRSWRSAWGCPRRPWTSSGSAGRSGTPPARTGRATGSRWGRPGPGPSTTTGGGSSASTAASSTPRRARSSSGRGAPTARVGP